MTCIIAVIIVTVNIIVIAIIIRAARAASRVVVGSLGDLWALGLTFSMLQSDRPLNAVAARSLCNCSCGCSCGCHAGFRMWLWSQL